MLSDDLPTLAIEKLMRVIQLMLQRDSKLLSEYGITVPQFTVLRTLLQDEEITQQELAEKMMVTKGNVSQMLKIMERDGLITRVREGTSKRVMLTDKARDLMAQIGPIFMALIKAQMAGLSRAEQRQLIQLLGKMIVL